MKNIKSNIYLVNTILNYIFKIFNMGVTYITIPLTLSYLDNERYGIWQTILTIIAWASLSNFGIGNGLRNKVTESITEEKYDKLKSYITSAYIYLTIISFIILFVSVFAISFLDTEILFKGNTLNQNEIIISFIVVIFSFCINFVLGISTSIVFGIHKSSLVNFFQVLTNIITLLGIVSIKNLSNVSLINIALVYLIANTLSNILLTSYVFLDDKFRPSLKYKNKSYGKELTTLGLEFFILQCASIVLFSTDNFIISSFIGVNEVTNYSLVSNLFQVISTLFSILLVQLWSAVAQSVCKNEYEWIKNAIKRLLLLLVPTGLVLAIMVYKFDLIIKIWIGKQMNVNYKLVILAAIYAWIICFNGIFVNVQNGMSKIRVQTISSVISCVINIPMAYILIKVFNLGIVGVMLSNIICLLISSIMCSVDIYFRVFKKRRKSNLAA